MLWGDPAVGELARLWSPGVFHLLSRDGLRVWREVPSPLHVEFSSSLEGTHSVWLWPCLRRVFVLEVNSTHFPLPFLIPHYTVMLQPAESMPALVRWSEGQEQCFAVSLGTSWTDLRRWSQLVYAATRYVALSKCGCRIPSAAGGSDWRSRLQASPCSHTHLQRHAQPWRASKLCCFFICLQISGYTPLRSLSLRFAKVVHPDAPGERT